MDIISNTGRILNIYYYLGLSPYRINLGTKELHLSQWNKFVHVLLTSILGVLMMNEIRSETVQTKVRPMEQLLIIAYGTFNIARSFIMLINSIFLHGRIKDIFSEYRAIELCLAKNFNHIIRFDSFKRKHLRKFFALGIAFVPLWAAYFARQFTTHDWTLILVSVPAFNIKMFQSMAFLYIIFFVDALAFYTSQMNAVIARQCNSNKFRQKYKRDAIEIILRQLRHFKLIHFRLWTISQYYNSLFGWCTIPILLHSVSDLMYCIFWIFDEIKYHSGAIRIVLPFVALINILLGMAVFSDTCHSVISEVIRSPWCILE